jgi:hypothetical protein
MMHIQQSPPAVPMSIASHGLRLPDREGFSQGGSDIFVVVDKSHKQKGVRLLSDGR